MKLQILTKEWLLALVTAIIVLLLAQQSPLIARTDGWLYDIGQHLIRSPQKPLEGIAIIHLDPASLEALGGKSMERYALTSLLERISDSKATAVGILAPLAETQSPAGLASLERIKEQFESLRLSASSSRELEKLLAKEQRHLDVDARLATALGRLGPVVLPQDSTSAESGQSQLLPIEGHAEAENLPLLATLFSPVQSQPFAPAIDLGSPLSLFADSAKLGWFSASLDNDGRLRSFELLHKTKADFTPSLPLRLAALTSDKSGKVAFLAKGIRFGSQTIKSGYELKAYLHPYPQAASVRTLLLSDVLDEKFETHKLKGKVVIIADDMMMKPELPIVGGEQISPAQFVAYSTANLINNDFNLRPKGVLLSEAALFAVALLLLLAISRLRFSFAIALMATAVLALMATTEYFLLTQQLWLKSAMPILLLVGGTLLMALRRLYSHQSSRHSHSIAAAHRQLGLALQEQGKIELAFESFQKLPADETSLELIYNLALDFERKRRYERAVSVYDHILRLRPGFKDSAKRRAQAEQMAYSLGANSSQSTSAFLLMPDADGQKPHLGRYEVEKEIGRGAMGAVYLGRDPKIDRTVAIKTLALAQEFESDELKEVEERFFHEAAAAGRLNHPNIVTIYDAGEEHDLAYIAMEYLEGRPLSSFIAKNRLLPVTTVLEMAAQVADALDYASKQGVIHRDIKPANIMFDEKGGNIKIADFGIARITSSSHTRTGVILGTPAYMSPEQISCQKVDGRSDIFSLGATMFTLLTGQKAFDADSIAALSYKITSEKHPDPIKIRPELPACVKGIIDKALHKEIDKRYQSGAAMKRAIHRCLKSIS